LNTCDRDDVFGRCGEVLDRLDGVQIEVWLDGGWGVDALLCEQTRPHEDLDLIVRLSDVPRLREVLARDGLQLVEGAPDSSFVIRDLRGREIDVHAVRFDDEGNGIYTGTREGDDWDWTYPASGFAGTGIVAGREVMCLTPEVQMLCHSTGYEPGETDFHDLRLLHARFGTALPSQFSGLV
jgi:lincosamide nucleotidyltransferase A/C/D/E